jgi:hypothetical protein
MLDVDAALLKMHRMSERAIDGPQVYQISSQRPILRYLCRFLHGDDDGDGEICGYGLLSFY